MRAAAVIAASVAVAALACGGGFPIFGGSDAAVDAPIDASADVHAEANDASDASSLACDKTKTFGAPVLLVGQDLQTGYEYAPSLSTDELTLWFSSGRSDAASYVHLWSAVRPSFASPFGEPVYSTTLNGPWNDSDPWLSADGLTMYFESDRDTGGNDIGNLYVATRASIAADFSTPTSIVSVNSDPDDDIDPALDADGSLWFASNRAPSAGLDLWRAQLSGGAFDAPVQVGELESPNDDWSPTPSADGLTLFFASARPGGYGGNDIWVATRSDSTKPFSAPTNVSELNTGEDDLPHWLSPDGCRLYLERQQGSTYAIYVATRPN